MSSWHRALICCDLLVMRHGLQVLTRDLAVGLKSGHRDPPLCCLSVRLGP